MANLLTSPVLDGEVDEWVGKLSSELLFVLTSSQVPLYVQAKVASLGVTDLVVLAKVADTAAMFREFCTDDLTIAPVGAGKVLTSRLIGAWEAAELRGIKRKHEEAEQRVGDQPRRLQKPVHTNLLRAFKQVYPKVSEDEVPSKLYIETKLEEIEDDDLVAELLSCVLVKEEGDDGEFGMELRPNGTFCMRKKGKTSSAAPKTSEELRTKYEVMANAWCMVKIKMPDLKVLKDFDRDILVNEFTKWILGKDVMRWPVKNAAGEVAFHPPWSLVLSFELEVRKQAMKLVNETGLSLQAGLQAAMKDHMLYQRYFLNCLSTSSGMLAAEAALGSNPKNMVFPAAVQVDGSNSWKKSAPLPKVADPKVGSEELSRTICFKFQRGNCAGGCGRRHDCNFCGKPGHGEKVCKLRLASAEVQREKNGDKGGKGDSKGKGKGKGSNGGKNPKWQ